MKRFLIPLLAALALPTAINAAEVNCNSAVWKNKPKCKAQRDKVTNFANSSNNDLGGADLDGPNTTGNELLVVPSGTVSNEIYEAFCGLPTKKCLVSFNNGLLTINEGNGIKPSQISEIKTLRSCRQGGGCFRPQWDYDYLLTYNDVNRNERKALIAFKPGHFGGGRKKHNRFHRDIQIWTNTVIKLAKSPGTVKKGSSSNLGPAGGGGGGSSSFGGYTTQQQLNDFKNRYEWDKIDRQTNQLNQQILNHNDKY